MALAPREMEGEEDLFAQVSAASLALPVGLQSAGSNSVGMKSDVPVKQVAELQSASQEEAALSPAVRFAPPWEWTSSA